MRRSCLVGSFVAALLFAGCAEERPPINRVQPNALPKKFFVGEKLQDTSDDPEFYTRTQVVDVGYGASQDGLFTSSWGTAEMTRVKFVVQENLLLARLTYERIADSDGKGAGRASNDGVIVAAFPITSHFDIRRAYSTTTGEEMNVIEENSYDRPWYEREYMRVDFSRNLNVDSYDFDTLSLIGLFGGVIYEPLAYYVNDPNSEDAPHFDSETGYFDVTTKAFAKPQLLDLSYLGWGISTFPACFLDADVGGGGAPAATCNPVELTLRQAFRRVVDTDFEPQEWDGQKFMAFGGFYKDRYGYARNYGMVDDKWHRMLSHYNIWQRSHYYADKDAMTGAVECYTPSTTPIGKDPHRDDNANGTEDECEAVTEKTGFGGSRCDTFTQKCTLPFRAREAKPITWYVTTGSNPEAFEGTDWATHDWDIGLRMAVTTARLAECKATSDGSKGALDACEAAFPMFKGQMDDIWEAIRLGREVDDCRAGKAYVGEDCEALATRLGNDRTLDPGVVAIAKMKEMVSLCHSPVEAKDPAACAADAKDRLPAGTTAADCYAARKTGGDKSVLATCNAALNVRIGDIRYHTVNNLDAPQDPSSWGIMLDSNDPLTGETVSSSINVWTHVTDLWAQGIVDLARVIKGELKVEEVTEGQYIKDYAGLSETIGGGAGGGAVPGLTARDVNGTINGMVGKKPEDPARKAVPAALAKQIKRKYHEYSQKAFDAKATALSRSTYEARRRAAVGTAVEAELSRSPAMQQLAGTDPSRLDNESLLTLSSPLRGANPALLREIRQRKEIALAERGACVLNEAPTPLDNANLANALEEKFGKFNPADDKTTQFKRAEKMKKYIAAKAQHSVIVHEMGHSFGLRHNFVSSADAFFYRPQYWQLRTQDGKVTEKCWAKCTIDADCPIAHDVCKEGQCYEAEWDGKWVASDVKRQTLVTEAEANNCISARYYDPTTETERKNMINMWMQSSIMDYAGEASQDLIGLGAYDYAAMRMFYGNAVAVFENPALKLDSTDAKKSAKARALISKMDNFGGTIGLRWEDYSSGEGEPIHYSDLQNQFGLISECTQVDPQAYKPASWDAEQYGTWHPLVDGQFVASDPAAPSKYTRCKQMKVDYVPWAKLKMPEGKFDGDSYTTKFGDYYRGGPSVDPTGRLRVPYGFATDRWADLGNLSVYRHDNGADAYELFDFFISQQETGHIFTNYRRHRQSFSVRNASNRALGRYNEKMRDGAKGLGLMANVYRDFYIELGIPYDEYWPYIAHKFFKENILASAIAFDFFTRQLARPTSGPHFVNWRRVSSPDQAIAESALDTAANPSFTIFTIPEGAYGVGAKVNKAWTNVGYGGRLVENRLAPDYPNGEYSSEYTINCGSYYDKAWTAMLLTESVDNFISDSRRDFVDPRYRSVSMADLFPEGYRRWLASNLTNDQFIKAPRVYAKVLGPDGEKRPTVERPEAVNGVDQFCDPLSPNCPSGSTCCPNERLEFPFSLGVCIAGTQCPQKCGYEAKYVNEEDDPPCPEGETCCQGLCSKGQCFIDTTRGMGWTSWTSADGPQFCFWSDKSMQLPSVNGGQVCSASPVLLKDTFPVDPQVGWEQQKFLIAMTLQYLPENQMRQWIDMMTVYSIGADPDPGIVNRIELHDPAGRVYVAKTFGKETIFGKRVQKGVAARVLEYANELLYAAYETKPGKDVDGDGQPDWYEPLLVDGVPLPVCPPDLTTPCTCANSPACQVFERYMSVPSFMRQVLATYSLGDPRMKGVY